MNSNVRGSPSKSLSLWDADWRRLFMTVGKSLLRSTDRVTDGETDRVPFRDDEREAISPLLRDGFEISGGGLGRIVLRFPGDSDHSGFVVKFARAGTGLLETGVYQNRVEVETWLRSDGLEFIVPPVEWSASEHRCYWVIFPRGTPLSETGYSDESRRELVEEIAVQVRGNPECMIAEQDIVEPNVVMLNGEPKLADYGRMESVPGWV